MKTQNKVVCLVGPSGVGKTSFAKRLAKKHNFALPIVVTTRQQRSDDDGRYLYVTELTFMEMINSGYLLEWDKYSNYYYGTLTRSVEESANTVCYQGIILDLTPGGCIKVKKAMPATIIIALLPDDPSWLFRRLLSRNSQPSEEIKIRTNLLREYLNEINLLTCKKVYVGFSPDSWDKTFEAMEKIVFEIKTTCG
ncbi:MAG: AAA family ATPase [Patescibacteria group bacterium]